MGYRSDVRLIVSKKGYDELHKFIENKIGKTKNIDNLLEECDLRSVHKNGVLIGWDSVKWYEWSDNEDVDTVLAGLKHLEEKDYSYHFARLGENFDDYDENNFDSENDDECIPYVSVIRKFDDEDMKAELSLDYSKQDNGVER